MGFKVKSKGDFNNIETYIVSHRLGAFTNDEIVAIAEYGLELFRQNTPKKTGKTANSWGYNIIEKKRGLYIEYYNTNIQNGANVAILIDNGHATKEGYYVAGNSYIDNTVKELCRYINKI